MRVDMKDGDGAATLLPFPVPRSPFPVPRPPFPVPRSLLLQSPRPYRTDPHD